MVSNISAEKLQVNTDKLISGLEALKGHVQKGKLPRFIKDRTVTNEGTRDQIESLKKAAHKAGGIDSNSLEKAQNLIYEIQKIAEQKVNEAGVKKLQGKAVLFNVRSYAQQAANAVATASGKAGQAVVASTKFVGRNLELLIPAVVGVTTATIQGAATYCGSVCESGFFGTTCHTVIPETVCSAVQTAASYVTPEVAGATTALGVTVYGAKKIAQHFILNRAKKQAPEKSPFVTFFGKKKNV